MTPAQFETKTGITPTQCIELTGISKTRWFYYKKNPDDVPGYIHRALDAHAENLKRRDRPRR